MNIFSTVFCLGRLNEKMVTPVGTCFAVGEKKLATAAHNTGGDDSGLVMIAPRELEDGYQREVAKEIQTVPCKIVEYDPIADVAILSVEDASFGQFFRLGNLDSVLPMSNVTIFGFPHAPNGRHVLTGISAIVGAKTVAGSDGQEVKNAVVNCQARPGLSGGPVIDQKSGLVVATVIGAYSPSTEGGIRLGDIDPQTLHQTTNAVSAEYIGDML